MCKRHRELQGRPLQAEAQGPPGYAFNAFNAETDGAHGEHAKRFICDLVKEASANSRPTTANLYNWSASKY
jgi:hypothetical protein